MDKKDLKFENFLLDVNPAYHEFVMQVHQLLLENGCGQKLDMAKNGYVVSYSDQSKRAILNFVFRKGELVARIYGDGVSQYNDFWETLPDGMIKAVAKAPVCRRLIDITKCNSTCRMGYEFALKGVQHQKCQYSCFMFPVRDENNPFLSDFLKSELTVRKGK